MNQEKYIRGSIEPSFQPEGGRDLEKYENLLGFKRADLLKKDVLDLGAGPEIKFAKQLNESGIEANVIELSPEFNEEKYRIKAKKFSAQTPIISALGQELPFKPNSFDVIVNLHVVEWLSRIDELKMFSEMARVLKDGGRAYIGTFTPYELPREFEKDLKKLNVTMSYEVIPGLQIKHRDPDSGVGMGMGEAYRVILEKGRQNDAN